MLFYYCIDCFVIVYGSITVLFLLRFLTCVCVCVCEQRGAAGEGAGGTGTLQGVHTPGLAPALQQRHSAKTSQQAAQGPGTYLWEEEGVCPQDDGPVCVCVSRRNPSSV